MLFLEDFLELVEGLPAEVRDKCTLIRELDLSVQNQVELLRKKVDSCCSSSGSSLSGGQQVSNNPNNQERNRKVFDDVENGYKQASIDADEKIKVMMQLFDLVERYSRRLDQDLNRFKLELEADNAGITQILEAKVSRQLAEEETTPRFSNFSSIYATAAHLSSPVKSPSTKDKNGSTDRDRISSSHSMKKNKGSKHSSDAGGRQSSFDANGTSMSENADQSMHSVFFTPPTSPSELSSMVDSNDSMLSGMYSLPLGMESTTNKIAKAFTGRHPHSSEVLSIYPKNRPKRLLSAEKHRVRSGSGGSSNSLLQSRYGFDTSEYIVPPVGSSSMGRKKRKLDSGEKEQEYNMAQSDGTDESSSEMAAADSSEQRWCICNDFSYGNMIACDNLDCPIEWFHYPCVGIPASGTTKRKWYCPDCRLKLKKKSSSSKKL